MPHLDLYTLPAPVLDKLRIDERADGVQALVLTPTRELAIQVAEAIHTYGKGL
jgi:ATP-dependent RNA helicase DeaD